MNNEEQLGMIIKDLDKFALKHLKMGEFKDCLREICAAIGSLQALRSKLQRINDKENWNE